MGSHGQHLAWGAGCLLHSQPQADVPSLLLVPQLLRQARAVELCPEASITPVVSERLFNVGAWSGVSRHRCLVSLPSSLQAVGYPAGSASGLPMSRDGRSGGLSVALPLVLVIAAPLLSSQRRERFTLTWSCILDAILLN